MRVSLRSINGTVGTAGVRRSRNSAIQFQAGICGVTASQSPGQGRCRSRPNKGNKKCKHTFLEEQKMCLEINFLCKESPTSDFVQDSKKRIEREKNLNGEGMKDFFISEICFIAKNCQKYTFCGFHCTLR